MRWRNRRQSTNVEDRRHSNAGRRRLPSLRTIMFLYPMIKPLLGTKIGWALLLVGGVLYFSGFNPMSMLGGGSATAVMDPKKEEEQVQFIKTVLADTEAVWGELLPEYGLRYTPPVLVLYRDKVMSGCGYASAQAGPFYCPMDQKIYVDLGFFEQLKRRHGVSGDFAQAYVLTHEVGHHVQNLQGILQKVRHAQQRVRGRAQANALQVKVELMADCYSGVWANHAQKRFNMLEPGDIEEALNAASAIGDDVLQKQAQGYVVPDAFTHGSARQRVEAFTVGIKNGDLQACIQHIQ